MDVIARQPRGAAGKRPVRPYSPPEEIASGAIHGVGAVLSIAGLTLLVAFTASTDGWRLASAVVYGVALVVLYTASTLYHVIPRPRAKHALKVLDHAGIYMLIAGTYTPFTLVTLRAKGGWWLFGVIWGIAIAGIAVEMLWVYRPKWLSALIYLAMGWLVVVVAGPLVRQLPSGAVWLLVAGGLAYSLGTIFYVLHHIRYMHSVWHLFVLGGSVCHFVSIAVYVLPRA